MSSWRDTNPPSTTCNTLPWIVSVSFWTWTSRPAQYETPWPSLCTALCLTGSSSGSTTLCSTSRTWRRQSRYMNGDSFPLSWVWTLFGKTDSVLSEHFGMKASNVWCPVSLTDPVHWRLGHLWFRGLREQQLWAVLHQLRQRTSAALLQPAHLQTGAGELSPPPCGCVLAKVRWLTSKVFLKSWSGRFAWELNIVFTCVRVADSPTCSDMLEMHQLLRSVRTGSERRRGTKAAVLPRRCSLQRLQLTTLICLHVINLSGSVWEKTSKTPLSRGLK